MKELEDVLSLLRDKEATISLIHSLEESNKSTEKKLTDAEKRTDELIILNELLSKQIEALQTQIDMFKVLCETLKHTNEAMESSNQELREQIAVLQKQNDSLRQDQMRLSKMKEIL